jgi:hypothetical protein
MSQCWSEGALRAYLDGELPPEDMNLAAAHLEDCPVCNSLCTTLAARAAHVSALVETLVEMQGEPDPVKWPRPLPVRAHTTQRQWAGAVVALAAGLALAALLVPKHEVRQPAVTATPPAPPAFAVNAVQPAGVPPAKKRPAQSRSIHRAAEAMDYFLALDNEPIESGVVMRVGVDPGNLQADIVFGPDGRAHAIRLVSGKP